MPYLVRYKPYVSHFLFNGDLVNRKVPKSFLFTHKYLKVSFEEFTASSNDKNTLVHKTTDDIMN